MSVQVGTKLNGVTIFSIHSLYVLLLFLYPLARHMPIYLPHIKLRAVDILSKKFIILLVLKGRLGYKPISITINARNDFNMEGYINDNHIKSKNSFVDYVDFNIVNLDKFPGDLIKHVDKLFADMGGVIL